MELPRLSVVLPNYNHAAYLPRCLEALLKQSAPPFEIIVVDDASTDDSVQIIERFAREHPTLRLLRNQQNQGAVKAACRGLEAARGEYVFVPSADDEVVSGLFEASLRLLAQYPQAALSCTVSTWRNLKTGLKWQMGAGMAPCACYLSPDDMVRVGRRGKLPIPTSAAILKKQPMEECGGYLPELRWHADWFITAVLAFRHGLCYVPESLSNVDLVPASFSRKGMRSEEQRRIITLILDKLCSPACADIAPRIRDSAALAMFGWPLLRLVAGNHQYRRFFTSLLAFWCSYRMAEVWGNRLLPRPLARLALRAYQLKSSLHG